MLEHVIKGYAKALSNNQKSALAQQPHSVKVSLRAAARRSWKTLARERIAGTRPNIPKGDNFWPLSKPEESAIAQLFEAPELSMLATTLKSRPDDAKVKVVDAAYWVKGCSSLGLLRYAVLLRVGDDDYCLMDVKQAVQATAPRYTRAGMPRDNARRVAAGARAMSPALGERMVAQRFMGHGVFIRELLPQDLKLEIDQLSMNDATQTAHYLAYVVGRAHARQMDEETRNAWSLELQAGCSKKRRAPAWLWDSLVHLVASHEGGYLEHCRQNALA